MESIASMPLSGLKKQEDEAMERAKKPAAHFFKACRLYNGCIQNDKEEYHWEKGIQSVSPLSGAQVSTEAVAEVHPNKVPIRITSAHTPPAPTNRWERKFLEKDRSEPPLTFGAGVPHVMVDPDNDLLCFSSFGNDWNRDENFSGGNAFRQISPVARARRVGLGVPPLTRSGPVFECKDCGKTEDEIRNHLAWSTRPSHYCGCCVSDWVTFFRNLEQVFLIVPGLAKAEPGDDIRVYRFGDKKVVENILSATKVYVRDDHFPTGDEDDFRPSGAYKWHDFVGVETIEPIGSDGPLCFDGNGIKLYETCAWQPQIEKSHQFSHLWFLDVLFKGFCSSRQHIGEMGPTFDGEWGLEDFQDRTLPETTKIAGGVIEFRVLTYELQEGDE